MGCWVGAWIWIKGSECFRVFVWWFHRRMFGVVILLDSESLV